MSVTRVGDPQFFESNLDRFRADARGTWSTLARTSIRWSVILTIILSAFVLLGWTLGTNPIPLHQAATTLALALPAGAILGCLWELIPRMVEVNDHHLIVSRSSNLRYWSYDGISVTPAPTRPDLIRVSCEGERCVLWLKARDVELFRPKLSRVSSPSNVADA